MKALRLLFLMGWAGVLTLLSLTTLAQPGAVIWQRLLDKNSTLPEVFQQNDTYVADVEPTVDNGCVLAVSSSRPYIARFDELGNLKWAKEYEIGIPLRQIAETSDGDFIGVGIINDNNRFSFVIAELTSAGILKSLRRVAFLNQSNIQYIDFLPNLLSTADGGFLTGCTDEFLVEPNSGLRNHRVHLLKINKDGETQWQKTLGGTKQTTLRGLMQAENGGYVVSLFTNSPDVLGTDPSEIISFGVLLNEQGNIAQTNMKAPGAALQTTNGNFVDVKAAPPSPHMFTVNWYDPNLNLITSRLITFSFFQWGFGAAFYPTPDGGVLVGDPYMDNSFQPDFRLTKYSKDMKQEWQQTGGGNGEDIIHAVRIMADGNYLIVGRTNSPDNSFFGTNNNPGAKTIWIRKQTANIPIDNSFLACFEAENAAGTGHVYGDNNASGGQAKGEYGNAFEYVEYNVTGIPTAGTYTFRLHFRNGESPTAGIIVNGGLVQTLTLPKTGSGYGEVGMNITLNAGINTIRVQGGPGGAFTQDKICIIRESSNAARAANSEPILTDEADNLQLTVYPNPNDGQFKAQFYGVKNSKIMLKVTDMSGRVLTERWVIGRGVYQEETFSLTSTAGKITVTLQRGTQRITKLLLITR